MDRRISHDRGNIPESSTTPLMNNNDTSDLDDQIMQILLAEEAGQTEPERVLPTGENLDDSEYTRRTRNNPPTGNNQINVIEMASTDG